MTLKECQVSAALRVELLSDLIEESIGFIHAAPVSSSLVKILSNLINMRLLTGAIKEDIRLLGGDE